MNESDSFDVTKTQFYKETSPQLVVYGMSCTWWDNIENVAILPNGIPCCPHCGSVLLQQSRTEWDNSIRKFVESGNPPVPDYAEMIFWARGKCFPSMRALIAAHAASKIVEEKK